MRYALLPEHHHYFEKTGSISFNELIPPFVLEGVGRDLWREDPNLAKLVKSKKLAEIAGSLLGICPLRLLYDEGIVVRAGGSLEETSAFQGVVGGWLLKPSGEGIFFSKTAPITCDEGPALLVVYGKDRTVYFPYSSDPYKLFLKRLGYQYGDRLEEKTHPIVLGKL